MERWAMNDVLKPEEDPRFAGLEHDRRVRCGDTAARELAGRPIGFVHNKRE
jgi:hypothetical protein